MRFWILVLLIITVVAALFRGDDLFASIGFNPLGNNMEPKTFSDNDDREREMAVITNDNEPEWGTVNYGSLDALKTIVTDQNGVNQIQIGQAESMGDMVANSLAKSEVAPLPQGLTVHALPGVQPNGANLNSFVFSPRGSDALLAPRTYYFNSTSVSATATKKGIISDASNKNKSKDIAIAGNINTQISIFQVPFNEESFISSTNGVAKKPSDSQEVAIAVNKTLNKLSTLAKNRGNESQLANLFFGNYGLSTEFNNVNKLINTGRYADSYKSGLTIALGKNDEGIRSLPGVSIKTELGQQDIYAQFDFIHNSLKSGRGSKNYSPELVSWGKENADSIIQLLMVNYMLQSQFQGSSGGYATPMYMGDWGEGKLPFYKLLNTKGRLSKEPFYLYCGISPKASSLEFKGDVLPKIPSKYIQPDLSYIFSLYTNIMSQVWIGADGIQNKNSFPSQSQTWEDIVSDMNSAIKKNKVTGKELSSTANKVSQLGSEFENNNLVSGLSTQKKGKAGTENVYVNKEIIGALRLLLSQGENGNGKSVKLFGKSYPITDIGETKYSKKGYSYLHKAFVGDAGTSFDKWESMIHTTKDIPLQPAIFRSYWDGANTNQSAYIMMPTMLGGLEFPESLGILTESLLVPEEGAVAYKNLSYANTYVMAFNFKPDSKSKTDNSSGVVEVKTGKDMGTVLNKNKPIVLTGYLGGEEFDIVEYFKAQDALNQTMDMPPNKAKTVNGKFIKLGYLNLFEHFFTISDEKTLVGKSGGDVKYVEGFDFDGYKTQYQVNKSKQAITQISPDYTKFFSADNKDSTVDR